MHGRHPNNKTAHYVCNDGQTHKTKFCINRASSNIVRTLNDPDGFFRYLFADGKQNAGGPRLGARPESPARVFPQEDDPDVSVNTWDPDEPITMPFRSLKQLWVYGLHSLNWNDPESHSDLVIFEKWYKFLFHDFKGGNKVIQAKPVYAHYEAKEVEFKCRWQVTARNSTKQEPRWCTLILKCEDKALYKEILNQLHYHKVECSNGRSKREFGCKSALIAGFWIPVKTAKYTYLAKCTSRRQIYAITE